MSETHDEESEALAGTSLACPKCGSVEFFVLATAVVSADDNMFRTPEGEVVAEQFGWEATDQIIDDGEESPLTCADCGHTLRDRDLVVGG